MTSDAIVIGGGLAGAAVAWRLGQRKLRVKWIDRGEPGGGSRAAGGILCAQVEAQESPMLLSTLLRAEEVHARWAAELGADRIGYRLHGVLQVAETASELATLEADRVQQAHLGLTVAALSPQTLREVEPALSGELLGANFFERGAQVDSRLLLDALYSEASRAGVEALKGSVETVIVAGGRVSGVRLNGASIEAPVVVLAAGAWSSCIEGTGLSPAAVRPIRGQMLELVGTSPALSRVTFGAGGYLVPRGDRVLVGSTMEHVGFRGEVTDVARAMLLARAARLCPHFARSVATDAWFGFRPALEDGLPAIGSAHIRGLYLAIGFLRNGVLLSPLAAEAIVAAVFGESGGHPIPAELAAERLFR